MSLPTLKIVRPAAINAATLTATNVSETPPAAWNSGTNYAADAQAGDLVNHLIYQSLVGSNLNHPLTDDAWWVLVGPNNRWAMFDQSNSTQTANANTIDVTVTPSGRVDSVALFNVEAASVTITATAGAVEIYNETFNLTSTSGIDNWYDWFFEPIDRVNDLVVTDIPAYSSPTIHVTIDATGATAKCGTMIVGLSRELGMTLAGAETGILDYSKKVADDFGNYTIQERTFSKKLSCRVVVENTSVDQVQALLIRYRATPIVWQGTDQFASTAVFGFYRSFSTVFSYPDQSECSLEIEGLT